ncbi:MAG: hypothetical protein JNL05_13060 [Flavobacteriales bacterium]|nr:hypothetical protein [Flavobacteriales bacterium]
MVLFLFPSGQADSSELAAKLYATRTLYGMLAVTDDRAQVASAVLKTYLKVVVPDVPEPATQAWHDVLAALRLLHHPVQTMTEYLLSITAPAPAHAVPTNQHAAGVGHNTPAFA